MNEVSHDYGSAICLSTPPDSGPAHSLDIPVDYPVDTIAVQFHSEALMVPEDSESAEGGEVEEAEAPAPNEGSSHA